MGKRKWTREEIIRLILQCDAEGVPLTAGKGGISFKLYQAGSRIFGSWRNALEAAGISPERGNCVEKWPPAKILTIIRNLSRRRKPLLTTELEHRYGSMMASARRHFGSWSKAVVAAGVDPARLRRVQPWTRERTIEAILTRALRNEPLAPSLILPRSLVEAGRRLFGKWASALEAAGLDPKGATARIARGTPPQRVKSALDSGIENRTGECVIAAIRLRLLQQQPLNATAVLREDSHLYRAARHHFRCWRDALLAAGLCPSDHRLGARHRHGESHADERLRPACSAAEALG